MESARVPGFTPSTSGFRFSNSFPAGIPVVTIPIPGTGATIPLGDASNGVCGGMVYGALDLFLAQPRLRVPPDTTPPAGGTPLTNYILARLMDSFALPFGPASNVARYIDFMSTLDHDTWLSHGIPWIIANNEWPKIKQDIDAGRPSPLGLVSGSWVWPTNISAKIKMLGHCHQVLAYGYDLDDAANLTLLVYDPNDPYDPNHPGADDSTISMNIGNPTHTTPISTPRITDHIAGNVTFRAFFRHEFYAPVAPPAGVSPGPLPVVLPSGPAAQGDDMQPGEVMPPDQPLTSPNGRYRFVYQGDGNLVLYRTSDGAALWASATDGTSIGVCIMQGDGNLVIYDAGAIPVWSSDTWRDPGSRLIVQDDGNVVIYRPDGTPIWATNTMQPVVPTGPAAQGDDMQPGEVLVAGQPITSASGRYSFIYQGDGNLVLYDDGAALWASATDGTSIGACIMQGDGNLVIYDAGAIPVWASGTSQFPGSRLVVQDDGNVVIYAPDGSAVWSTNTWLPAGPVAQGDDMQAGEVMNPGQSIGSANGRYSLVYQGDGNLVLYDGSALWTSGTDGRPAGVCMMQGDGNLVLYARGGEALWDSGTSQHGGSGLIVQDDGNVVIYAPDGTAVWATNTVQP
jgi:hypothetical protein